MKSLVWVNSTGYPFAEDFFPTGSGEDFQLSPILADFESVRDEIVVVDGVSIAATGPAPRGNNHVRAPGKVLTSMLKRVDIAAYDMLMDAYKGKFSSGIRTLGLAEGGVDWAVDDNNKDLIAGDVEAAVAKARKDILSGAVVVHNYESDSNCPH